MTTDFIDADSGWESKTLESWLFVVDFVELLIDQVIGKNAQINDLRSDSDFFDEFPQNIYTIKYKIPLAILAET